MDEYNPATVFSSIDEQGRYAYGNQPRIALWNLTRLAECLLPLFSDDNDQAIEQAQFILGEFPEKFTTAYHAGLRRKIGLFTARDGDEALVQDLLDAMAKNEADFTLTFRHLSDAQVAERQGEVGLILRHRVQQVLHQRYGVAAVNRPILLAQASLIGGR